MQHNHRNEMFSACYKILLHWTHEMFKKFQTGIFGRMERAQNIKEDQQFISISKDKHVKVAL